MRYKESRDQTAELLRMIVPQMARHTAGFHPMSYAVWYEYHAGLNPKLKTALDAYLAERNSLTDADIIALYETHIAPRDAQHCLAISQSTQLIGWRPRVGSRRLHRGSNVLCSAAEIPLHSFVVLALGQSPRSMHVLYSSVVTSKMSMQ